MSIDARLKNGYEIAQHGDQWRAQYTNSVGKTHFVGEFNSNHDARRGILIWSKGIRFDRVLSQYQLGQTIRQIAQYYDVLDTYISEAIKLCGITVMRKVAIKIQRKKLYRRTGTVTAETLAKSRASLANARAKRWAK